MNRDTVKAFVAKAESPISPAAGRLLSRLAVAATAALALSGFLYIGSFELQDWDEALYAWRAKICVNEGAWIDQHHHCVGERDMPHGGFYSGAFPPFYVWATAVFFKVFGFTEWAARFWAAAAGAGCLLLIFALARMAGGALAGFFAALLLASITYFTRYSGYGQFDIPYLFFVMLTLWLALKAQRGGGLRYWIGAGVALGAGLMTKIAVALMAPVILAGFALYRIIAAKANWRAAVKEQVIILAVGALVMAPWHFIMWLRFGRDFLWWTIAYHLLGKAQSGQNLNTGGPFFYLIELSDRAGSIVWRLALVGFLVAVWVAGRAVLRRDKTRAEAAIRKEEEANDAAPPETPFARGMGEGFVFFALWLFILIVPFSLAETKRSTYALPMYPPLAALAALTLAGIIQWLLRRPWRPWLRMALAALIVFGVIVGAYNSGIEQRWRPPKTDEDWGWQALRPRLNRRDFDQVIGIGNFVTNRAIFYLHGAPMAAEGWSPGIDFKAFPADLPSRKLAQRLADLAQEAEREGRRVIIIAKFDDAKTGERLRRIIRRNTGYELIAEGRRLTLFEKSPEQSGRKPLDPK